MLTSPIPSGSHSDLPLYGSKLFTAADARNRIVTSSVRSGRSNLSRPSLPTVPPRTPPSPMTVTRQGRARATESADDNRNPLIVRVVSQLSFSHGPSSSDAGSQAVAGSPSRTAPGRATGSGTAVDEAVTRGANVSGHDFATCASSSALSCGPAFGRAQTAGVYDAPAGRTTVRSS